VVCLVAEETISLRRIHLAFSIHSGGQTRLNCPLFIKRGWMVGGLCANQLYSVNFNRYITAEGQDGRVGYGVWLR
jgi:hypothetical protein